MEFLSTIISEVGKCLYEPVKRHCGYLFCYARNVEKLSAEVTTLSTHKNDVDNKLEEERRTSQKEPLEAVKQWKEDVEKVARQANVYSGQLSGEQRPIQMGGCWCLNVITWRYKLGKDAAKEIVKVQELTNDLNNFHGDLTHCPPPSNIVIRRSDTFQNNESTASVEGRVKQALGDDKCRSIGIYGMGGIGKTTLVEKINNDMTESNLFDKIIMVTVSQNPDLKRIQEEIAGSLGILKHFTEEVKTDQHRASLLFNELKNCKCVLIILDDVWKELEMARVGIPRKAEHPCCKIIITTRDCGVCDRMGMEIKISVEPWSPEDSRKLFDSKVGQDIILKNPQLEPLANEIIEKLGGSPLAIVTLASALVGKDDEVSWKDASRCLQSSDPDEVEDIEGMETVINSIKYSYNNLPGDQVHPMKLCFLFCGLFPEDYDIDLFDLRTYGIGEGFLRVDGSLLDARGRLESYIKKLKARNLLIDSSEKNCVRMHDVVRYVARLIASKEHGFIGKAGIGLNEWPELLDNAEDCKRMSLMHNDICVLPANNYLNMPELRTLLLTGNTNLNQIPDNFFAGMNKLVNLDLSGTSVSCLSPSMSCLTSLRTLNASKYGGGGERDMSLIGKLKKLEILILGYEILKVPNGLGELTNLKVLHLRQILKSIPEAVIPKLLLLEELCLETSYSDGLYSDRSATFAEVASLKHLTTLQLAVTSVGTLSEDIPLCWKNNNLQEFIIYLSNSINVPWNNTGLSKFLFIENLFEPIKPWVLFLLQKTEELSVQKNKDFWYFPYLDSMNNLKRLQIFDWAVMKNVANIEEVPQATNNLGRLERLRLRQLPNLERICQGPLGDGFVMNLKKLIVSECEKIQSLMPLDLLQASQSLESVEVEKCVSLTHVVSINVEAPNSIASDQKVQLGDQYSTYSILSKDIEKKKMMLSSKEGVMEREGLFPKLNELTLKDLPNLVRFYNILPQPSTHFGKQQQLIMQLGDASIESNIVGVLLLQNLTMLRIESCHSLNNLFTLGSLQKLRQLHIKSCDNLKSLFKLSMIQKYGSLHSIQRITVEYCSRLKWIVVKEEDEDGKRDQLLCDHLTYLRLENLPELMSFYNWDTNILLSPSLEKIRVIDCENFQIQSILPVDILETSRLISLKSLLVKECKSQTQLVSINAEVPSIINSDKAHLGEHSTDEKMKKLSFNNEAVTQKRGGLFPVLDELILIELPNLMSICLLQPAEAKYFGKQLNQGLEDAPIAKNEQMTAMLVLDPNLAVFLNLTTLRISGCHNLKYLFSLNMFQNGGLQELQEINIFDCNNLKWILVNEYIEEEEKKGREEFVSLGVNEEKGILFPPQALSAESSLPRLKALNVRGCAELVSCVMTKKRYMDKLDDPLFAAILIWPELMDLNLSDLPNLLCLYGEEGFGNFLLQHPPLTHVIISGCPKLWKHNINSSSLLGNNTLINLSSSQISYYAPLIFSLRELQISDFDQTQHIFGFEEGICTSLFHKLETLILKDLPRLESICRGYIPFGSFASLRYVKVSGCHSLRRCLQFSLFLAGRSLQHLQSLVVESCEKLEKLMTSPAEEEEGDQKVVVVLPRLRTLHLINLAELTSLYEGGDAFLRLPSLKNCTIVDNRIDTLVQPFLQADTSLEKEEEAEENQEQGDSLNTKRKIEGGGRVMIDHVRDEHGTALLDDN